MKILANVFILKQSQTVKCEIKLFHAVPSIMKQRASEEILRTVKYMQN